ncbi:hypothetical protein S83_004618, partial [Arachis hypogaea]
MRLKVEDQASTFMASLVIGFLSKRKNIPLLQITSDLLLFILRMDDYQPSAYSIDDSEIYDPTVNSWNELRSPVDHPLFSQSEIQ